MQSDAARQVGAGRAVSKSHCEIGCAGFQSMTSPGSRTTWYTSSVPGMS